MAERYTRLYTCLLYTSVFKTEVFLWSKERGREANGNGSEWSAGGKAPCRCRGGRWRHGAFSAAAAFARLCERRLTKAKCGKVDLFQPEVACRARQVDSRTACRLPLPSRREMVVRAGEKMTPYQL